MPGAIVNREETTTSYWDEDQQAMDLAAPFYGDQLAQPAPMIRRELDDLRVLRDVDVAVRAVELFGVPVSRLLLAGGVFTNPLDRLPELLPVVRVRRADFV